jgi:hypothetical protein
MQVIRAAVGHEQNTDMLFQRSVPITAMNCCALRRLHGLAVPFLICRQPAICSETTDA